MSQGALAKSTAEPELTLDDKGRYLHVLGAGTGTLEQIPGCEGLTLDLDALWAEIDKLE